MRWLRLFKFYVDEANVSRQFYTSPINRDFPDDLEKNRRFGKEEVIWEILVYIFTAAITVEHDYVEAELALGDAYATHDYTPQAREIYAEGVAVASRTPCKGHLLPHLQNRLSALA